MTTDNRLDFISGISLLPWDQRQVGAVFSSRKQHTTCLSGRCNVLVRRGYDEQEGADYGQVVEGLGDLGINVRSKQYSFTLSAASLSYKAGNDAPLKAQSFVGTPLPSLKFTFATEVKEDVYASCSYDISQRRPELAVGWSGDTLTERSSVSLRLDPVDRCLDLRAAVSFPGPEWRVRLFDERTGIVHYPKDDGGRHQLYVKQLLRGPLRQLLGPTQVGASFDLGRLLNWTAEYVDTKLKRHIPGIIWAVPFTPQLYGLLVPDQDEEQQRYNISGWSAEVQHDFQRSKPLLGLSKKLGGSKLSATYDLHSSTAGVALSAGGFRAGLALSRTADGSWKRNPQVMFSIEPLAFL